MPVIGKWLRRIFGPGSADQDARVVNTTARATESFRDAFDRGARLHPLDPSELPPEFQAKLVDICKSDSNVAGLWLLWLRSGDAAPEIFASLLLERPDQLTVRDFIRRADALGGPSFAVGLPGSMPSSEPFYLREGDLPMG